MKNIVISGSSKLQNEVRIWIKHFVERGYVILDYPVYVEIENYSRELPVVYRNFYRSIEKTDVFFCMNEDKNGEYGYIGSSMIAEITFAVMQNLIYSKNIDIYILKMPQKTSNVYDEIKFFYDMGWIKLYNEAFTLREQIQNYNPYDDKEFIDKSYFINCFNNFNDLLTRKNRIVHFTSSALVLNKDRSKCLVVYHNIYDGWIYPGGHADGNEDLLAVAVREVEEETGQKVKVLDKSIYSIQSFAIDAHIKRGEFIPSHVHLDVAYLFEADDTVPLTYREDESKGAKWILLEDISKEKIVYFAKPVFEKLLKKLKSNSMI